MCKNSHNIDLILDDELQSKKGKKDKALVSTLKGIASTNGKTGESGPMRKSGSHNSGNDAFMTGYYFIYYLITNSNKTSYKEFKKFYEGLKQFRNKIFLAGKVHPLNIMPSSFAKPSKNHKEKMLKLQGPVVVVEEKETN